ncbi:GNAT family N-acetyltransferase [Macrococcoides caseolyticum]|uniref:GNAT family N-acetyltransferase n=1 Tax=Macrococcoides caseolyticum TaxID=69966 RepID=UPI001F2C85D1|nr:GNAT family protein [Macrococcus caseolyticus]MCE4956818.1 GNAT family N-acetyltransferase [Macrococcus caseolyticus]
MFLKYRPLSKTDKQFIYELLTHDGTSKYQAWTFETMAQVEKYIEEMLEMAPKIHYRVIIGQADTIYGVCSITVNNKHKKGEIGYMIHPDYWGKGIATQAAKDLIRYGFDDLSLNRIYAVTDVRNNGSIRVLEKCGLQREGHMRQDKIVRGNFRDSYMYSLLRFEYHNQKK